jgi:hypothetical protein
MIEQSAVPPSISDEDYIALLIGRVIMAWGLIDQLLFSAILRLESHKAPKPPFEIQIDERFEHRLKCRKLCVETCQNDHTKMTRVDRVLGKIRKASALRHHLAHGYIVSFRLGRRGKKTERPNLHVIEHREATKRLLKNIESHKKDPTHTFWAEDLHPIYTIEDIEAHLRVANAIISEVQVATEAILPFPQPRTRPGGSGGIRAPSSRVSARSKRE